MDIHTAFLTLSREWRKANSDSREARRDLLAKCALLVAGGLGPTGQEVEECARLDDLVDRLTHELENCVRRMAE